MSLQYLIFHKDRGQPRYDIAIRDPDFPDRWLRLADERRVFPHCYIALDQLGISITVTTDVWNELPDCYHRETWPDYNPRAINGPGIEAAKSLLDSLGLSKPSITGTLTRRV